MRPSAWLTAAIVMVLLGSVAVDAFRQDAVLRRGAAVSGRVIDADSGRPVPGAVVRYRLSRANEESPGLITSQDGAFRFPGVPDGILTITADSFGYLPGAVGKLRPRGTGVDVGVDGGRDVSNLTIRLWRQAVISGRVTSPVGEPLAHVGVAAVSDLPSSDLYNPTLSYRGATDDAGEYAIAVPGGTYHVVAPMSYSTFPVRYRGSAARGPFTWVNELTSENGRYRMNLPVPAPPPRDADGRETIYVTSGYPGTTDAAGLTPIVIEGGARRSGVDFMLQTALRIKIRGVARGPSGPLEKTIVRLTRGLLADEFIQAATAEDGRFEFLAVPPGTYEFEAQRHLGEYDVFESDPEGLRAHGVLTVGSTDIDDFDVVLTPGRSVRGKVVVEGAGVTTTGRRAPTVRLQSLAARRAWLTSNGRQSGTVGGFVSTGMSPGRYGILVSPNDWSVVSVTKAGRLLSSPVVEVDDADITDLVVTIVNRTITLSGSIRDSIGAPAAWATAVLIPADASPETVSREPTRLRTARAGIDGRFTFRPPAPGDYIVGAMDERDMDRWPAAAFLGDIATTGERVTLAAGESRELSLKLPGR
jgi:hypothetical protein